MILTGLPPLTLRFLVLSSVFAAALVTSGCQAERSTTPSTPEHTLTGIAKATAFQNVPRVRGLEQASGRTSMLTGISGPGVDVVTGSITPGNGWHYLFMEPRPGGARYHDWRVSDSGAITVRLNIPRVGLQSASVDIDPFLAVDSREAARLARDYGGQQYLDRYPGARLSMSSRFVGSIAFWDMLFWVSPPADGFCVVPVVINAQSGELVSRDTSCLDRQSPP